MNDTTTDDKGNTAGREQRLDTSNKPAVAVGASLKSRMAAFEPQVASGGSLSPGRGKGRISEKRRQFESVSASIVNEDPLTSSTMDGNNTSDNTIYDNSTKNIKKNENQEVHEMSKSIQPKLQPAADIKLESELETRNQRISAEISPNFNSTDFLTIKTNSRRASSSASSSTSVTSDLTAVQCYGIVLVDFDHALGPKVEYTYPECLIQDQDLCGNLPFLALPDGAHARDEDYSYFHLLCPSISSSTIFGISCNRQIASSQLVNKKATVTRSTVQKAIVVLASKPVFGPIRDKLGVIIRAYFAQKDFQEKGILVDFYTSLESGLSGSVTSNTQGEVEEGVLYMGTSIRELVHKFRFRTLMLLKLLLLQRKIMFYGTQVERLCTFQYSLVSLIPNLLLHLEDAASPLLDSLSRHLCKPTELRTSDRRSLLKFLGLPLNVFGRDAFFQPYLPLQQIDLIESAEVSYLVGTTNSIFQQQKDCKIDAIVNIDTGTIEFHDQSLANLVNLTAADRYWMDEIVSTVQDTWNAADPGRPIGMKFVGSDDYLRAKFEEYICSTLAAIKFVDYLAHGKESSVLMSSSDISASLSSYNESWIAAFRKTHAFSQWNANTDAVIFDLVEPRHPCEGMTNVVADVGIRLAQGMHNLHLDENLAPAREAIGKGIQSGTQTVWAAYSAIRNDLSKRQAEAREKRAKEQSRTPTSSVLRSEATPTASQISSDAALRAASLANSVGSFFTAKRNQFFASPASNGAVDSDRPTSTLSIPSRRSLDETRNGRQSPINGDGLNTFPPSVPSQSPTSASGIGSPFGSFFRSAGTVSETPTAPINTTPSFFRRVSSALSPTQIPTTEQKSPGLRELTLSTSPRSTTLRSSPSTSSHSATHSRPSSVTSGNSTRSGPDSRRSSFQVIEEEPR